MHELSAQQLPSAIFSFVQGEDADEAREKPVWLQQDELESAASDATAVVSGLAPAASVEASHDKAAVVAEPVVPDLLNLLGEFALRHCSCVYWDSEVSDVALPFLLSIHALLLHATCRPR